MSARKATLLAVTRRYQRAHSTLDTAREDLYAAVRVALAGGVTEREVVRVTGLDRGTVRKVGGKVRRDRVKGEAS